MLTLFCIDTISPKLQCLRANQVWYQRKFRVLGSQISQVHPKGSLVLLNCFFISSSVSLLCILKTQVCHLCRAALHPHSWNSLWLFTQIFVYILKQTIWFLYQREIDLNNNLFNNTTLTLTLFFRLTNIAGKLNDIPIPLRNSEVEKPQKLNVMESDLLKSRRF